MLFPKTGTIIHMLNLLSQATTHVHITTVQW